MGAAFHMQSTANTIPISKIMKDIPEAITKGLNFL
jgi:hypothetical protein